MNNNHLKLTFQHYFQRARKFRLTQQEFALIQTCKELVYKDSLKRLK